MAAFPRTLKPFQIEIPSVPTGIVSVGRTGKAQLRSELRAGRRWSETWSVLDANQANAQALLAFLEEHYNTNATFTIEHLLLPGSGLSPNGAGGGTPLINGASESGDSIASDGWSASVTGIVKAGDVIRIAGLPALYRIREDANSDGSGNVTLKINPIIAVGSEPANNAAITRTGCTMTCFIADFSGVPSAIPDELLAGLRVVFQEAL